MTKPTIALVLVAVVVFFSGCNSDNITIIASVAANAASPFKEIGRQFEEETGIKVIFNFASSGQLAQQIISGAPVDFFASANAGYVEEVEKEGMVASGTKAAYARGQLTLWTPKDKKFQPKRIEDLSNPEVKKIAIANPEHAPYGVAAREALRNAGIWEKVRPKLVMGENVNQAMHYGTSGNVDVVIVPLSLSLDEAERGQYVLVRDTPYPPIEQTLAIIKGAAREKEARQFADFVRGPKGAAILKQFGYDVPE